MEKVVKQKIPEANAEGAIPKILIPSGKLISEIFGIIFIIVLLWSILGGNNWELTTSNLSIEIGWPWSFLYLEESYDGGLPINILNLILDMLVYLVASYIIAVVFTVIWDSFRGPPKPISEQDKKTMNNLRKLAGGGKLIINPKKFS